MKPNFSVVHATARFPGWVKSQRQCLENCDRPDLVQYLLGVDSCDMAQVDQCKDSAFWTVEGWGEFTIVENRFRRTSVDAYNEAARKATGNVLLIMQDDIWCPPHWDTELLKVTGSLDGYLDEFVIWVSSGGPRDAELMAPQVLSYARYKKCGYVWYPGYLSMYADDELTQAAVKDGVVIEARHLLFEQRHPYFGTAQDDEIYAHENRPESYSVGAEIFARRKAQGFPKLSEVTHTAQKPTLAVCLPGESFSSEYLAHWTMLANALQQNFGVACYFGYYSDVYACRNHFVKRIEEAGGADFVLWIDDDNILKVADFAKLYEALVAPGGPDLVAAWCWVYGKGEFMLPYGDWTTLGGKVACDSADPAEQDGGLKAIGYTGFPAVLHRGSVLDKVGPDPFRHYDGLPGEDVAFCRRAWEAGLKLAVHTGVRIPHLKRVEVHP